MAVISFNIACKELKIAQIAQLNQLLKLLPLAHIYGHGFNELSRMLMSKSVNNNVSKDWPVETRISKSWKIDIFPKELTNGFGPKIAIFPTLFLQAM